MQKLRHNLRGMKQGRHTFTPHPLAVSDEMDSLEKVLAMIALAATVALVISTVAIALV